MSKKNEAAEQKEKRENLSEIICFRMRPSDLGDIEEKLKGLNMSRSQLIRSVIFTGGVVYVGNDVIGALSACRVDLARIGNLLKMVAGQLQLLNQMPTLVESEHAEVMKLLGTIEREGVALVKTRKKVVQAQESLHEVIGGLNGDL